MAAQPPYPFSVIRQWWGGSLPFIYTPLSGGREYGEVNEFDC